MKKKLFYPALVALALMVCLGPLLSGRAQAADGEVKTDEQGREYVEVVFDIYHEGTQNIKNITWARGSNNYYWMVFREYPEGLVLEGAHYLTQLFLPEEIDGKPVIGVLDNTGVFGESPDLRDISFPGSVGRVECYLPRGLLSCKLGEGITVIGNGALSSCSQIQSITLPSTLEIIGDNAFIGCTGLTSISIPDGVTEIGPNAFQRCTGIKSVTLPSGLSTLGEGAFKGSGITSVTVPSGITEISKSAFSDCKGLRSVTLEDGITAIGESAFAGSGVRSLVLPEGLVSIGKSAFEKCSSLNTVDFPASLQSIGENAFRSDPLIEVTLPEGFTSIERGNFSSCRTIHLPASFSGTAEGFSTENVYYAGTMEQWFDLLRTRAIPYRGFKDAVIHASDREGRPFEVTLVLNGSVYDPDYIDQIYVLQDQPYGEALYTPSREGYEFRGWYTEYTYKTMVTQDSIVSSNTRDLYAKFTVAGTVTLHPEGGTVSPATAQIVDERYGPLPTPTHPDPTMTFDGWHTKDGSLVSEGSYANVWSDVDPFHLYAHWTGKKIVVSLQRNDGTSGYTTAEVTAGGTYGACADQKPADRAGYTFAGWYTQAAGGTRVTSSTTVTKTENHSLYAHWNEGDSRLEISPSVLDFGTVSLGYGSVPAKSVTFKNVGTSELKIYVAGHTEEGYIFVGGNYRLDGTSGKGMDYTIQPGKSVSMTVQPSDDIGYEDRFDATYAAYVISGSSFVPIATFDVRFEVKGSGLELSTDTLTFEKLQEGYEQPKAQTVTVKNTGSETMTLTQPAAIDYDIGRLSTTSLRAGASATFTVAPKKGLKTGIYNETITVRSSKGQERTLNVRFTVEKNTGIAVTPATLNFGTLEANYAQPRAQTVTVKNTSTNTIILTQPTAANYDVGRLSATTLRAGASATFTVTPKKDLKAGNYNITLSILTNNKDVQGAVALRFTVGTPIPEVGTAYASKAVIMVDGKLVSFDAYALHDAKGNETNYLKLRDVAKVINGSRAQFDVDYRDGSIVVDTRTPYAHPNGTEMSTPFTGDQTYKVNIAPVLVDGKDAGISSFVLKDARGGGYTYYKVRDLGKALGFNVSWDNTNKCIVINTNETYTED